MVSLNTILLKIKQRLIGLKIREYKIVRPFIINKRGLEIGGPSAIFKSDHILPIYLDAERVDGVNFSNRTVWENNIDAGETYDYSGAQKGYQFIAEASDLKDIPNDSYDFLLSSHSLEHCANALRTIIEWKRVIRPTGIIVLVLPNKQYTFDQNRSITTFDHLLDDYKKNVDETDLTHVEEIMDKHDIRRDPGVHSKEQFMERSLKNIDNRCLHHHVFDVDLLTKMFKYLQMNILVTSLQPPHHIILIAQKL